MRVMITLDQAEREALRVLARREGRDPRRQAVLCIRLELERRGLLRADDQWIKAQAVGGGNDS